MSDIDTDARDATFGGEDVRNASNVSGEEPHQKMEHTSFREGDSKEQEAETTRSCRERFCH